MAPVTGSFLLLILCCVGSSATDPAKPGLDPGIDGNLPIEKIGTCPADVDYPTCKDSMLESECKTDKDCKGERKCCYSGCRMRCLLPVGDKINSCPYFNSSICIYAKPGAPPECHSDDQCQGTDRCCCVGCRSQCTPTVKPGLCPAKKDCDGILSRPQCKNDNGCTGDMKCCDVCGMRCVAPQKENAGFCPSYPENLPCATLKKSLCSSDADCPRTQKCCTSGNVQECQKPVKVKPGTCPIPNTRCMFPSPPPLCDDDSNCADGKKCCTPWCQQKCTDPVLPAKKECPVVNTLVACSDTRIMCNSDYDCTGTKRCCDTGCIVQCVDI